MRRISLLSLLVGAFVLVGCGGGSSGTASASPKSGSATTTVAATLSEFKIVLDKSQAPSGNVTFNAKHDGTVPHELMVVRSDIAEDKLPLDSAGTMVDEAKVTLSGHIAQFDTKTSKSGTFTLAAGKYIVFCNVAAHYAAGMHTAFTVQ